VDKYLSSINALSSYYNLILMYLEIMTNIVENCKPTPSRARDYN